MTGKLWKQFTFIPFMALILYQSGCVQAKVPPTSLGKIEGMISFLLLSTKVQYDLPYGTSAGDKYVLFTTTNCTAGSEVPGSEWTSVNALTAGRSKDLSIPPGKYKGGVFYSGGAIPFCPSDCKLWKNDLQVFFGTTIVTNNSDCFSYSKP